MLYLEAVIEARPDEPAVTHARYPKAKLTICGADLSKVTASGTVGDRVNCDGCVAAKTEAIRTGKWTNAQMAPTKKKKRS